MTNGRRAVVSDGGGSTGATQGYVLGLQEVDRTSVDRVGGKGASLGELASKLGEVRVPAGFCVTVAGFRRVVGETPAIGELLERLAALAADDRGGIREISGELRRVFEAAEIPEEVRAAVTRALVEVGADEAYAVRSSATAEDLPGASFAGQQDTFLNVRGESAILQHVRRCWASLFSERAVSYRSQHGLDHRTVYMAVVVQRMVFAEAAGVLFTADPISSNRKVTAIEATFGLGEALVGGLANVDGYRVRDGEVIEATIAGKALAVVAVAEGGTEARALAPERRKERVLTRAQVLRLERLGRRIEAHFDQPQDIEWCLAGGEFFIVQSRPITTLYPIPEALEAGNHVYLSVGHQQMMTDAMKPLGLSLFQRTTGGTMQAAGGRLFVDTAKQLASPTGREAFLNMLGRSEPLMRDALVGLLERGDFSLPAPAGPTDAGAQARRFDAPDAADPAIVAALIERGEATLAALARDIRGESGTGLFDFILDDLQSLKRSLFAPESLGAIMTGMNAAAWINEKMLAWLGEKNAADLLSQSVPHNVTSEMGLALMDVADVIRPHAEVVAYLRRVEHDGFLDELGSLDGGVAAQAAIRGFLSRYGARCAGEIDITRARWCERPTALVPSLLNNIKNFAFGAGARRFERGRQAALRCAQALLERLRALPDGPQKADEAGRKIDQLRGFIGYREYPKFGMIRRYFIYKQALLREVEGLVRGGVLDNVEDAYYLRFEELREVVRARRLDREVIGRRRAEHELHEKLRPPRVMTSDGEVLAAAYKRSGLPAGAIAGLAVSSGVVEGRARVVLEMAEAELEAGDILVTVFTDPSWTPLFVGIKGLVTEVGGLMTHGAVIAREYGLPAVVGVQDATREIRDGQTIRVNGTDGYVEILG